MTLALSVSDEVRALAPGLHPPRRRVPRPGARRTRTAFGTRPSRSRTSAEAFAERALSDAGLPRTNRLVEVRRDDEGVTCRRWNGRQGVRTRLTEESVSAVFLPEGRAWLR